MDDDVRLTQRNKAWQQCCMQENTQQRSRFPEDGIPDRKSDTRGKTALHCNKKKRKILEKSFSVKHIAGFSVQRNVSIEFL